MSEREEKFERMLQNVQERYADAVQKMEQLKAAEKTKSVTYKQLMAEKLTLQKMLSMYQIYGLIEE
ncbi:MAG: hypothetical protein PUE95_01940 [Lachnospiraceae bacterium]|nr:hypothetical protein [Lachnospiraceae bacterium]